MLGHDAYLVNATVVRERVRAAYGIDARVVFPPTVVTPDGGEERVGPFDPGFHLVVSRLLPYKNVDKAVDAFRTMPDERLLVIGRGPEEDRLRAALPANVAIVSDVSDAQLRWAYRHAVALVAPSIEDFGLTPLEAGAFAKPTLALRGGGYLDTVAEGVNGLFFDRPDADSHRGRGRSRAAYAVGRGRDRASRPPLRRGDLPGGDPSRRRRSARRSVAGRSGRGCGRALDGEGSPTVSKLSPSSRLTIRSLPSWTTSRSPRRRRSPAAPCSRRSTAARPRPGPAGVAMATEAVHSVVEPSSEVALVLRPGGHAELGVGSCGEGS